MKFAKSRMFKISKHVKALLLCILIYLFDICTNTTVLGHVNALYQLKCNSCRRKVKSKCWKLDEIIPESPGSPRSFKWLPFHDDFNQVLQGLTVTMTGFLFLLCDVFVSESLAHGSLLSWSSWFAIPKSAHGKDYCFGYGKFERPKKPTPEGFTDFS